MVGQEVVRGEERRQVVVGVGEIGEPAELINRVGILDPLGGVGHPFGGLQVDPEQPSGVELAFDRGVFLRRRHPVVVGVVLQVQRDRRRNLGVGKVFRGLGAVGFGAVGDLERLVGARDAVRDHRVRRRVGALVHVTGQRVAVE